MRAAERGRHLRRQFGITLEQEATLLAAQDNRCAICGITRDEFGRTFDVDHCHDTGRIRGLLCNSCNLGIGKLKDSPALLARAIAYLTGE